MPTLLSDLPEEVLLRLCDQPSSTLYPTCKSVVEKVRRVVRSVAIRYLHYPEQVQHYPRLKSVRVYSIDLRNHTLHDYLPSTVTDLFLMNVSITSKLFSLIPDHVLSLELNVKRATLPWEERRMVYGDRITWSGGRHQEFNLPDPDYSLLHKGLKKLKIGSTSIFGGNFDVSSREFTILDLDRDQSGQPLPDCLEEWYTADLIYPCKNRLSTNLRVVHADLLRFFDESSLADVLPSLESFRMYREYEGDRVFSSLPVNLTDFRVNIDSTPELMALLKKSKVTSLALKSVDTKSLWEGLKELYITGDEWVHLCLDDLPRSLRCFHVVQVVESTREKGWPQLETLYIFRYAGAASPLPSTIRTLSVDYELWLHAKNNDLRPISLSIYRHTGDNDEDIPYIHSLPDSVTSLQVSYLYLYQVPLSVKYLSLANMDSYIPSLPPGLLTLQVGVTGTIVPSLIEALPRSLRELDLSESALSTKCIKYLPPHLVRLDVRNWEGDVDLSSLPKSLAVIQSSCATLKTDQDKEAHPALCHAYSFELEQ